MIDNSVSFNSKSALVDTLLDSPTLVSPAIFATLEKSDKERLFKPVLAPKDPCESSSVCEKKCCKCKHPVHIVR